LSAAIAAFCKKDCEPGNIFFDGKILSRLQISHWLSTFIFNPALFIFSTFVLSLPVGRQVFNQSSPIEKN
jgi:hypothetical protein